jgi:lactate permease
MLRRSNFGDDAAMLLIQTLPLLALVILLASGRAQAPISCAVAMLLALPAAWLDRKLQAGPGWFVGRSLAEGLWLAVVPVGIITGGLVFHAGVAALRATHDPAEAAAEPLADRLFTASFLLGPFAETVTGFGVGTVFAVGAVRAMGVAGAPAAAIGLMAQALIPWGGLGPGSAIGAALAGVSPQAMTARNALALAPALLLLLPLFWWWCRLAGVAVPWRTRLAQSLWLAAVGGLLIVEHAVLPWELCGMMATGPVLAVRQLLARPPRGMAGWRRAMAAAAPYALLAALLLGSRLWRNPPSLTPFDGLPSLPLNHAMVAIWIAAAILLVAAGRGPARAMRAIGRARRPALALLGFVVLARVLANAGIPVALAAALVAGFGSAAPFASPLLAAVAGFFAGTNVGSNAAMMPLQAALGHAAGLGPAVLPAVQNGTLALVISPQMVTIASTLAGGEVTPGQVWRIMWPVAVITLVIGTAAILIG